jgi:hypothetical protein
MSSSCPGAAKLGGYALKNSAVCFPLSVVQQSKEEKERKRKREEKVVTNQRPAVIYPRGGERERDGDSMWVMLSC